MVYVNANYSLGITICTKFTTARNFSQKFFPKLWIMQFLPSISKDFENTNFYKAVNPTTTVLSVKRPELVGCNI